MRAWIFAVAGAAALISLPAHADRDDYGHFRGGYHRVFVQPYFGFGFSYGYPGYPFDYPFRYYGYPYDPFYSPYYGLGVRIRPHHKHTTTQSKSDTAAASALKLYVYPTKGQSKKQTADDRYQCHEWAVGQTHYDPTLGAGTLSQANDYRRAFTACMEARNYVVK